MKTKRFLIFGLPVLLLVLGLVVPASLTLAGCDGLNNETSNTTGDEEEDEGDSPIDIELDLPALTEATSGSAVNEGSVSEVTMSSSSAPGASMPDELEEVSNATTGVAFSIEEGVFSFTLPEEPEDAHAWNGVADTARYVITELFGEYIGAPSGNDYTGIGVTIVDSDGDTIAEEDATIEFAMVDRFNWSIRNTSYQLDRQAQKGSAFGNGNSSKIVYVYASEDVTLSRDEKDVTVDPSRVVNWGAVDLALQAGWNLVQIDTSTTSADYILTKDVTVKIADKNVPWTLSVSVSPPYKAVMITNIPHAQLEKGTGQGNPQLGVVVMNTMPQTGAPTGVVAFYYQSIQNNSGQQGDSAIVSARFGLSVLSEWPPTYSNSNSWTGTGNYYVALIPYISNNGAAGVPKLDSGKVYAEENSPATVNFNDDELPYVSGSYGSGSMVLTLSYTDFIDHDFSDTE
jgi:hypothetical protein